MIALAPDEPEAETINVFSSTYIRSLKANSMKIVLATRNEGKVLELSELLSDLPVQLISAAEFPEVPDVKEDGSTLEENARKKAVALARFTALPALADDTGLEVDALDGRPGVHSARFAGEDATDEQNRVLLLSELSTRSDRSARFRTVLAYADGDEVRYFEGTCEGIIGNEERGEYGFGYDSIFIPRGHHTTFAEMQREEKNAISHRGRALQSFAAYLRDVLDSEAGAPSE